MSDEFLVEIEAFVTDIRERAGDEDGLTVSDLAASSVSAMTLAIKLLDMRTLPGEEKKAEVLKLVAYLFDSFADRCVPMLALPAWWLLKPAVRSLILAVASGAVEPLLLLTRGTAV